MNKDNISTRYILHVNVAAGKAHFKYFIYYWVAYIPVVDEVLRLIIPLTAVLMG